MPTFTESEIFLARHVLMTLVHRAVCENALSQGRCNKGKIHTENVPKRQWCTSIATPETVKMWAMGWLNGGKGDTGVNGKNGKVEEGG